MKILHPYVFNGFALTLPVILWNAILASDLPPFFSSEEFNNVQLSVLMCEHFFRLAFFAVVFMMPITKDSLKRGKAWSIYIFGLLAYVLSWIFLMVFAPSMGIESPMLFFAPSLTPILWMVGIIQICAHPRVAIPYRNRIPWITAFLFILFHNLHVYLALSR